MGGDEGVQVAEEGVGGVRVADEGVDGVQVAEEGVGSGVVPSAVPWPSPRSPLRRLCQRPPAPAPRSEKSEHCNANRGAVGDCKGSLNRRNSTLRGRMTSSASLAHRFE